MAWLKFTSKVAGDVKGAGNALVREVGSTTHLWGDFKIDRLRFARPGAVFLPVALLIAKLAAGEVPHDYGVDLKEGLLYQRTVPHRTALGHETQVHPLYERTRQPMGGYGPSQPSCYVEHEAMTLIFSYPKGDDPYWLADGTDGERGQAPEGRTWLSLAFEHAGGYVTRLVDAGPAKYLPGHFNFPEDKLVSIFGFCASEEACEPDDRNICIPAGIGAAFCNTSLRKAFDKRLGHDKIVYEEDASGRRKLLLGGDEWRDVFPAEHFEWGGLLAFNLNAEGRSLRPFQREATSTVRRPPPGLGRLYIHRSVDAWRTVVALPGRRMFRLDRGLVWLRFHALFAFRITHDETSERTSIFRGVPLADQERIWAVPGLSSALNHTFNGMKGRLAGMPAPLVAPDASPCSTKVGNICVFGDDLGGRLPGFRRAPGMPRFDETIEAITMHLGANMLRANETVQPVAPRPLTRARIIDL